MTPKAGETVPLSGLTIQVLFNTNNLDPAKQFSFMPELVREGRALGPVFFNGFVLNKYANPAAVGVKPGHYIANSADKLAASGGGYQYRITVYEGTWGQGHKVVASGLSGTFSFGPAPVGAGPPQVTVITPKAGETVPLSGVTIQVSFNANNLDPNKQISFIPELVRNGRALGPVFFNGFILNSYAANPAVVGVKPGHYVDSSADKLAASGAGYQYRITVYEGTWGKGHKVVASGLSGTFSFGPAPVAAGPPQVSVMTPKSGQAIPLSGALLEVSFNASNLDPNKQLLYMPELVRNGVALGPVFSNGFVLNSYAANPAVVGVKPGHYIANFADKVAASGGGYQYRITVYEGTWGQAHKVVASGLSGTFAFSP